MQHLPYYYTAEQLKAAAAGGMMAAAAAAASGAAGTPGGAGIPGAGHPHPPASSLFTIDSILAPRPYLATTPQRPTPYFPYHAAALHAQAQQELLGE